eukprot:scaffold6419_cov116-Cylindrotheca_fusiformis.AAC.3
MGTSSSKLRNEQDGSKSSSSSSSIASMMITSIPAAASVAAAPSSRHSNDQENKRPSTGMADNQQQQHPRPPAATIPFPKYDDHANDDDETEEEKAKSAVRVLSRMALQTTQNPPTRFYIDDDAAAAEDDNESNDKDGSSSNSKRVSNVKKVTAAAAAAAKTTSRRTRKKNNKNKYSGVDDDDQEKLVKNARAIQKNKKRKSPPSPSNNSSSSKKRTRTDQKSKRPAPSKSTSSRRTQKQQVNEQQQTPPTTSNLLQRASLPHSNLVVAEEAVQRSKQQIPPPPTSNLLQQPPSPYSDLAEAVQLSRFEQRSWVLDEWQNSIDPNRDDQAIEQIMKLWKPKLPTMVLFFRWARRPAASHFNSDSISLVKILALQCGFSSPIQLVVDLKNYYVRTATSRKLCKPFGFGLDFAKGRAKLDGRIVSDRTYTGLRGLKNAFSFLQQQVLSFEKEEDDSTMGGGSSSFAGMNRDDQSKKNNNSNKNRKRRIMLSPHVWNVTRAQQAADTKALIRTYTPDSFEKRVWHELEHRVLAYHVVKMIVHSTNLKSSFFEKEINPSNILALSFVALTPCQTRHRFVAVLASLCLMIDDSQSIENHPSFRDIWSSRKDQPYALHDLAMSTEHPADETAAKIDSVFKTLRTQNRCGSVAICKGAKDMKPVHPRAWTVIKARIFSIWLKDFSTQKKLLNDLSSVAGAALGWKSPPPTTAARTRREEASSSQEERPHHTQEQSVLQGDNPPTTTTASNRDVLNGAKISLSQLLSSTTTTSSTEGDRVPDPAPLPAQDGKKNIAETAPAVAQQDGDVLAETRTSTTIGGNRESCGARSNRMGALCKQAARISRLRPTGQAEMDSNLQSYFFIYTAKENYVLQLAPVEVYSADNLRKHKHERRTGPPANCQGSFVCSPLQTMASYIMIRSFCTFKIDTSNDVLHVVRPGAPIFDDHASKCLLAPVNELIAIILRFGREDHVGRSAGGVFRLNFGCGGLSFKQHNGAPTKLVGVKFFEELDSAKQSSFVSEVGALVTFVWGCMKDMQVSTRKPRLATQESHNLSYSNDLCNFLNINREIPLENVTLCFSSLHPDPHQQCDIHFDKMNDSQYSDSKTGTLNMAFTDDTDKSMYLLQVSRLRQQAMRWMMRYENDHTNASLYNVPKVIVDFRAVQSNQD